MLLKTKFFLEYLHLLWHSLQQLVCIQVCLELPRPIKEKIHYECNLLDEVFNIFVCSIFGTAISLVNNFCNKINSVGSSYLWILGLATILHFSTRVGPEIKVDFFDLLCACALSATGDKWSCTKSVLTGSIQRVSGLITRKRKARSLTKVLRT